MGSQRGGRRPPQLGLYKSGDLKGSPALCRSKKEGGRRPPEPYCKSENIIVKETKKLLVVRREKSKFNCANCFLCHVDCLFLPIEFVCFGGI